MWKIGMFPPVRPIDSVAQNILEKRYLRPSEKTWENVITRVTEHVVSQVEDPATVQVMFEMMNERYFIPNSPTLFNAGIPDAGLSACFVVGMEDNIDSIYQAKYDFARIARKGGGCGVSLSHLRPEGAPVAGSTHGYAGGPVKFYNTICVDMDVLAQSGKRPMAMLGAMSVRHPDIMKFINAKQVEGVMTTTNISVVVDDEFMEAVKQDLTYWTEFDGVKYEELRARDVFQAIVDGAWRNGEPGILFKERMNSGPYAVTGQVVDASNPCFTGDMTLLTADGYCRFDELAGSQVNIVNYNGDIVPSNVWVSGEKPVVRVRLSNGDVIRCTPDHVFMLSDGSECAAKNLVGKKPERFYEESNVYVTGVIDDGVETVYDFSEPETHWGVVDDYVVHNCGEQTMPANAVCNLGSHDLSKYMVDGKFDFERFYWGVRLSTRFLDDVIDAQVFPTEDIQRWVSENRPVGVGK